MRKINIFLLISAVLAGNIFSILLPEAAQAAPPTLASATFIDSDHNGAIDRIKVVFDDVVTSCKFEAGDWVLFDGSLTLTGPTWRLNGAGSDGDCDGSTNYFYLQVSGISGQTGYPGIFVPADIQYKNQGTLNDVTSFGGIAMGTSTIVNINDAAPPVVMSSSPANGAAGVSVSTSTLGITFSESMSTGTVIVTLSGTGWGMAMWSSDNKTLTYSRITNFNYGTIYTASVVGEDKNGYLLAGGASPASPTSWSFTTESVLPDTTVSASQSTLSASPTSVSADGSSVSVLTATVKNAAGSPLSGKTVTLSSSRGATDTIAAMTGSTGADGKAYFQVRSNTSGSPVFTATASGMIITQTVTVVFTSASGGAVSASRSSVFVTPSSVLADNSAYATVTVVVRDLSDNLLSGKTVVLSSSRGSTDTVASLPGGSITDSYGQAAFQVRSGTAGTAIFSATIGGTVITQTATVSFSAPPSSGLVYGDLFKESGSTAVYYYGTDGKRHVFPTQAIYFSWYSGFSGIKTVDHGTITAVPLGANVVSKPGTYLVQFVSMDTPFRVLDPKIYALESDGELRWVKTGEAASALYGADWERKIVAVPEVFRTNYAGGVAGADINSASDYSKVSVEASARTISDTTR